MDTHKSIYIVYIYILDGFISEEVTYILDEHIHLIYMLGNMFTMFIAALFPRYGSRLRSVNR